MISVSALPWQPKIKRRKWKMPSNRLPVDFVNDRSPGCLYSKNTNRYVISIYSEGRKERNWISQSKSVCYLFSLGLKNKFKIHRCNFPMDFYSKIKSINFWIILYESRTSLNLKDLDSNILKLVDFFPFELILYLKSHQNDSTKGYWLKILRNIKIKKPIAKPMVKWIDLSDSMESSS